MTDEQHEERSVPVFGLIDLLTGLAVAGWAVAVVVAFMQAADVSGGEQSPIEALVYMAPWVIVALGLTSVRRMLD